MRLRRDGGEARSPAQEIHGLRFTKSRPAVPAPAPRTAAGRTHPSQSSTWCRPRCPPGRAEDGGSRRAGDGGPAAAPRCGPSAREGAAILRPLAPHLSPPGPRARRGRKVSCPNCFLTAGWTRSPRRGADTRGRWKGARLRGGRVHQTGGECGGRKRSLPPSFPPPSAAGTAAGLRCQIGRAHV